MQTDTAAATLAGRVERPAQPAANSGLADRLWLGAGGAFVVLVLAGNTMTESAASPDGMPATLAAQAASPLARAGFVFELLGLTCLVVFAVGLVGLLARSGAPARSAWLAGACAGLTVTVKLAWAAPALAALAGHDHLPAGVLRGLVEANGTAFVLSWLPFAVFVLAAARALRSAGVIGRVIAGVGAALGLLGLAVALLGAVAPEYAVPVPFLLSLVWTLALSLRLALAPARRAR